MASSFNRKYELSLGAPSINSDEYTAIPAIVKADYNNFNPYYGVVITSLNISAKINRSSKAAASNKDHTVIEVYNMAEKSRRIVEKEGAVVILKAGYESSETLPIIFAGQVISVSTSKTPNGVVTEIIAGDAYIPQKNARISKYYPPATSKADIIKDLVISLPGVSEGVFAMTELEKEFYSSGYSLSGKVADLLDKFCLAEGYEFIIENNRAYVRPKGLTQETADYSKIRQRSFQVSSSQIKKGTGKLNNNSTDLSNKDTTKTGYRFQLFLEGRIKVASLLQVTDGEFQGVYKITGLTHTLDYRGKEWTTIVDTESF